MTTTDLIKYLKTNKIKLIINFYMDFDGCLSDIFDEIKSVEQLKNVLEEDFKCDYATSEELDEDLEEIEEKINDFGIDAIVDLRAIFGLDDEELDIIANDLWKRGFAQ